MRRSSLIGISVLDCALGAVALYGPHGLRSPFHALNFALAVILAVMTGNFLGRRGHRWPWAVALLYPFAPLFGLIAFTAVSARNIDQPQHVGLVS
ncbi:MAG: hypothetical protein QOG03_1368 [Actinomycetota bacterium]|jgi:hypothetical protein|nr:hypothetical protein [Actinomycetota bacterium]